LTSAAFAVPVTITPGHTTSLSREAAQTRRGASLHRVRAVTVARSCHRGAPREAASRPSRPASIHSAALGSTPAEVDDDAAAVVGILVNAVVGRLISEPSSDDGSRVGRGAGAMGPASYAPWWNGRLRGQAVGRVLALRVQLCRQCAGRPVARRRSPVHDDPIHLQGPV